MTEATKTQQLEFVRMVAELRLQEAAAARARPQRRRRLAAAQPADFAVALLRAVTEENVAYSTYALMVAIDRCGPIAPSLAAMAAEIGYSYHAVHKMIERTAFFAKTHADLVRLELSGEGRTKIRRINQRLERHVK